MAKKNKNLQESMATVIIDGKTEDKREDLPYLTARLQEISPLNGVLGYILKDSTSATVDLKQPEQIAEYALLASQALDAAKEFCKRFNLEEVESTIVNCGSLKVLCVAFGEVSLSVFMEKSTDHNKILKLLNGTES